MSDPSPDIKKENNTPKPQNSLESLNSILAFQVQDLIDRRIDKAEGQLREYNQNDLILMYSLLKDDKAKKLFQSKKKSFDEILDHSRFKTKITKGSDFETKIKEFLIVA